MGRLPRIRIPGLTFHVVQRGHDRKPVFFCDDDYKSYLNRLKRVSQRYETSVHAYVLMTNHVHLLLTSREPDGVSRTMQDVAGAYARRINERDGRTGGLWERRYGSSPIDSEFYCLACYRYIELNPVRAGMVASPADYPWSSHRENIGRPSQRIVEPHACFRALGSSPTERASCYAAIVDERLPDRTVQALRRGTSKCVPVGRDDFIRDIEQDSGVRFGPRKRGRPRTHPNPEKVSGTNKNGA